MTAVLPGVPWRVEKKLAQLQAQSTATGMEHGARPSLVAGACRELQVAGHAARRTAVPKCMAMDGDTTAGLATAALPSASLAKLPQPSGREDGLLGTGTTLASLPLLASTEATRLALP